MLLRMLVHLLQYEAFQNCAMNLFFCLGTLPAAQIAAGASFAVGRRSLDVGQRVAR